MNNQKNIISSAFFSRRENLTGFLCILLILGGAGFFILMTREGPARAWQAYLINVLLWSAVAQGGLLFSVIMHLTKARWSEGISALSESFSVFFPLSLVGLGISLFGRDWIFPWLHQETEKAFWLNLPWLIVRDGAGLMLLYTLGMGYVYQSMKLRFQTYSAGAYEGFSGRFRASLERRWRRFAPAPEKTLKKKTVFAISYAIAYALVLSLVGYDLVLSADPNFMSTLFGAYSFVKAFYAGLGALIILVSVLQLGSLEGRMVSENQLQDLGKLFFGFCLLWADFFYCQLVVIWYGNLPEETHYVILRTMISPWRELAWTVFVISFGLPFAVLLNKKVKTQPGFMAVLCFVVILGLWLEHLLLLGPELNPGPNLPLGFWDGCLFLGFLGLMASGIRSFLGIFPELLTRNAGGGGS